MRFRDDFLTFWLLAAAWLLLVSVAVCRGDEAADARVRVALALAAAQAESTPPPPAAGTYAEAVAACRRDGLPLAVFVGEPARPLPGIRTVSCPSLAGFGPGVVVTADLDAGVQLPPGATDGEVVAAAHTSGVAARWRAAPLNQGSCPCGRTGGCHCSPHSDCAKGRCAEHNQLLPKSSPAPAPAAPLSSAPYAPTFPAFQACRT